MFQVFTDRTFEFFMAIKFNNNRQFFHENHDWYEEAVRTPLKDLAADLAESIEQMDPDLECRPEKVVSRINRDIRFSNDKSPYRDCTWISFHHIGAEKGKLPGLFFELNDNGGFCGSGFYKGNKPLMDAIRRRILARPDEVLELYRPVAEEFMLYSDVNSRIAIPDEVPPELRALYAARTFYFEKEITDFDLIRSPQLADAVKADFKRLAPLYRYIISLYQPED